MIKGNVQDWFPNEVKPAPKVFDESNYNMDQEKIDIAMQFLRRKMGLSSTKINTYTPPKNGKRNNKKA